MFCSWKSAFTNGFAAFLPPHGLSSANGERPGIFFFNNSVCFNIFLPVLVYSVTEEKKKFENRFHMI